LGRECGAKGAFATGKVRYVPGWAVAVCCAVSPVAAEGRQPAATRSSAGWVGACRAARRKAGLLHF